MLKVLAAERFWWGFWRQRKGLTSSNKFLVVNYSVNSNTVTKLSKVSWQLIQSNLRDRLCDESTKYYSYIKFWVFLIHMQNHTQPIIQKLRIMIILHQFWELSEWVHRFFCWKNKHTFMWISVKQCVRYTDSKVLSNGSVLNNCFIIILPFSLFLPTPLRLEGSFCAFLVPYYEKDNFPRSCRGKSWTMSSPAAVPFIWEYFWERNKF